MTPDPAAPALALLRSLRIWQAHRPGEPVTVTAAELAMLEAMAEAYRDLRVALAAPAVR